MKRQRTFVTAAAVLAAILLYAAAPAIAHHSSAPFYDPTKKVEVKGTVTRLLVKNPHSFLYLNADDKGQKVEWQVEMGTGAQLARNNLTIETLKPGTEIIVSGQPARNEAAHGMCCIISLTKSDGTPILRGRVPQEPQ